MSLEALAARQVDKMRGERERNHALMQKHMPEFYALIMELKELGMFGRLCSFQVKEDTR